MSIHNDDNYPPSEWSFFRIAIRFFMYCLCLFLISIAVMMALSSKHLTIKEWRSVIGIFSICGAYIVIDIRAIIVHGRKRRAFKKKFPTSQD